MAVTVEPSSTASAEDDLADLLEHADGGNNPAVEQLISRLRARVRGWASRFTRDADEADDVAQVVMIGLRDRVRRYDRARPFATWLYVLTRRVALSVRRTDSRRRVLLETHALDQATEARANESDVTASTDALAAAALRHFHALPPRQRAVFEMAELRGLSHAEVARELEMRPSTVRAHLFKARANIRRRLMEDHESLVQEYRP